jgi:hypothetical protein
VSRQQAAPKFILVGGVLATLALLLWGESAQANHEPRGPTLRGPNIQLEVGVLKIKHADPIVDPSPGEAHSHIFGGSRECSRDSSATSLLNAHATTGKFDWYRSCIWVPQVRDASSGRIIPVRAFTQYYSVKGSPSTLNKIPFGLQLLSNRVEWRCGDGAVSKAPPVGCTADIVKMRLFFPDCWDMRGRAWRGGMHVAESNAAGVCPPTHPYKYANLRFSALLDNTPRITPPLQVSAGHHEWREHTFAHGDYFHANRPNRKGSVVGFNKVQRVCLRETGPNEPTPPICGPHRF